ncbi:MAG: aminomethyl-transferring glycine dehydrogenase subunit GcvPA [Candidatus Dormibacteria bacterium]
MTRGFSPHSAEERRQMLEAVGVETVEDLYAPVPREIPPRRLALAAGMPEQEVAQVMRDLAARNHPAGEMVCLLGAGAYRRYIPAAVRSVLARPEWYSAYTPYQAEASQGWLQAMFEFQSMIAELMALDVSNSSLYDGATSVVEACVMAQNQTGRHRMVVAGALHPEYLEVLRTFGAGRGFTVDLAAPLGSGESGACAPGDLEGVVGSDCAAVVVQQPSFLGTLQPVRELAEIARRAGALVVGVADPIAAAVIDPPGAWGADIAAGEAQQLGIPLWYGGPYLGYLACRQDLVRRVPGRLVGQARDAAGRRGFTLTLQAREQHIRRERATSNVCTNHALMALAAAIYLGALGPHGLREVAGTSLARAAHLRGRLPTGFTPRFEAPSLWEFAVRCPVPAAEVVAQLGSEGILAGYDLGRLDPSLADTLLVAVTETTSVPDLDAFAARLSRFS